MQWLHISITAFSRVNSPKYVPPVVEAVEKKNYSLEITKTDVSLMCQHSGGEEETEVTIFCIFKSICSQFYHPVGAYGVV